MTTGRLEPLALLRNWTEDRIYRLELKKNGELLNLSERNGRVKLFKRTLHRTVFYNDSVTARHIYKVAQKLAHFWTPFNFIKYRPIFKLFSLSESGEICNNTVTKDPAEHQVCRYTTW